MQRITWVVYEFEIFICMTLETQGYESDDLVLRILSMCMHSRLGRQFTVTEPLGRWLNSSEFFVTDSDNKEKMTNRGMPTTARNSMTQLVVVVLSACQWIEWRLVWVPSLLPWPMGRKSPCALEVLKTLAPRTPMDEKKSWKESDQSFE